MGTQITIDSDDLLEVARTLNFVVVSLDRLGSRGTEQSREEFAAALLDFVVKTEVFKRVAAAREVVCDGLLLAAESESARDLIEDEINVGPFWLDP